MLNIGRPHYRGMNDFRLCDFLSLIVTLSIFFMLFGCNVEVFSDDRVEALGENNQLKPVSGKLEESYDTQSSKPANGKIIPFCDTECKSRQQFLGPNQWDVLTYLKEANINGRVFRIEVVGTENERSKGLMNRETISDHEAMLFVFENEKIRSFWMKNTLMPLDLIFLSSSGEVLETHKMNTQIGYPDHMLKIYRSNQPVKLAIEVRGGLVEEIPILVGSYITFR